LQRGDVVAAQVGRREEKQAVTEPPRRLDQPVPRVLATQPVDGEAPRLLKGTDGDLGFGAEKTRLGDRSGQEPGGAEAALEVADGVSALARC